MASSDRSKKRPARTPANPRPRRKPPAQAQTPSPGSVSEQPVESSLPPNTRLASSAQNDGGLEGAFSMGLGLLLVIAALFPRTLRQLLMLAIGGGLAYRGMTGRSFR